MIVSSKHGCISGRKWSHENREEQSSVALMTRFQSFRIVTTPLTRLPFVSAHEFRFWFVATFAFARSLSSFPLSLPLLSSPSCVSFAVRGNGNMLNKQKKQKPDSPRLYRAIFAERMTTKRERRIVFVLCTRQQTL